MHLRVFGLLALVALLLVSGTEAQRKKKGKGRKDPCHLRELESCINKVQNLGKRKEPSVLITNNEGLNTICKTIQDDLSKCIKAYIKKCGTPLHREVADLIVDQVTNQVSRFCDSKNPSRAEFLKHSPCIHKKVLSQQTYKSTCNNNFLATVDQVDQNDVDGDKTHATICCGYNKWDSCTKKLVTKECGKDAYNSFAEFVGEAFGTLAHMVCPAKDFASRKEICKDLLPKDTVKGKGKVGDNALTKYVVSLFSFLFTFDE